MNSCQDFRSHIEDYHETNQLDQFLVQFNFSVSLTSLNKNKSLINEWSKSKSSTHMPFEEFKENILKLHKLCLKPEKDMHQLHINRTKGEQIIKIIIQKVKSEILTEKNVVHLIWSMVTCVHHFHVRLKSSRGIVASLRLRTFKQSMRTFETLIEFIPAKYNEFVVCSAVIMLREGKLWSYESICTEILRIILLKTGEYELAVNHILDASESGTLVDVNDARNCLIVLYEIFKALEWKDVPPKLISRFLSIYRSSIAPLGSDLYHYFPLKNGLFQCLQVLVPKMSFLTKLHMIQVVYNWVSADNLSDIMILEFTDLIIFTQPFDKKMIITEECFQLTKLGFDLLAIKNINIFKLVAKTMIHIADTGQNKEIFFKPRIFFQDAHYNIRIKAVGARKSVIYTMFKDCMGLFQTSYLNCIKNFSNCRDVLELVYCCLCIFLCEAPVGLTASGVACLVMAFQNYAEHNQRRIDFEYINHLHAVTVSLFSLICHIHKAEGFYSYINTIIQNRAKYAAHLNPPLKPMYEYPTNQVLYKSPVFLFDKWEIRYGLWTCFRIKKRRKKYAEYETV